MSLALVKGFLHSASRGIASLVFPDRCPCCLREGQWESCLALWRSEPSLRFIGKVPIISIVAYDDRAMSVVLAAKERGERRAKEFIMLAISTGIARLDFKRPEDSLRIIIPIPSSKGAIRRRGEDFIYSLAKEVLKTVAIADHHVVLLPILRWKRVIKDQSELTMRERIANLADSLAVDERRLEKELHSLDIINEVRSGRDLEILLIDDVITSGSTLAAAISAISHSSLGVRSSITGITACYSARGL